MDMFMMQDGTIPNHKFLWVILEILVRWVADGL